MCRDGSCSGENSCEGANIDYVVGPSCTDGYSCRDAEIGSVVASCNDRDSCTDAQLSGVDLIISCNAEDACNSAIGAGVITELVDCCNVDGQCEDKDGLDIVNAGCVSYMCI